MATAPVTPWDTIPVEEFTEAKIGGSGIYDVLMKANAAYMEQEYNKSRLRGPEYASVYLGMIDNTMRTALEFLVQSNKLALEAQTMQVQLEIAQIQKEQAQAALELAMLQLQKVPAEIALLEAQALQVKQQTANLSAEALNIPKQGERIDAETAQAIQQTVNLTAQKLNIEEQTKLVTQQAKNLTAEALNIPKQGLRIDAETDQAKQQTTNLITQELQIKSQTNLIDQQKLNAVIEGTVLTAQKCKLDAEYDVLVGTKLKVVAETSLLNQKVATEKAQTIAAGIDPGSVLGKQNGLYTAQTEGFARDAEQKAAKLLIDTWNVRRTTDEGTEANTINKLDDATIGRVVNKALTGINA